MSIYDKPVDRLTTEDLQELLASQAVENVRLEFKRDPPGNDETLKKLSSLANTYGGYLVVGAEASSSDGRITALEGVEPLPNYKQTIVQRCAQGISPIIQPFVSDAIPAPGGAGKVCYVVYVAESDEAPHFLNNRRGAYVYVRTDEYSTRYEAKLATAEELQHLFNRRRLAVERRESLIRRAATRFQQFADVEYIPRESGTLRDRRRPDGIGASMHIALIPRFPVAPLRQSVEVMRLARSARISRRGGAFPNATNPVSQHESALLLTNNSAEFSLYELNTWGLVFAATAVQDVWTPQSGGGQVSGIHLHRMLGHTLAVLEYARHLYDSVGFMGMLEVDVAFHRVRGVPIYAFPNNFAEEVGRSQFDDDVRFALAVSTDRLRTERDIVGAEVLRAALFALGWSGAGRSDEEELLTSHLLDSAYDYNMWAK